MALNAAALVLLSSLLGLCSSVNPKFSTDLDGNLRLHVDNGRSTLQQQYSGRQCTLSLDLGTIQLQARGGVFANDVLMQGIEYCP